MKVIPGEEVASQHFILVCDFIVSIPPQKKRKFVRAYGLGNFVTLL